ncbi:hypothetical protein FF1_041371 [Malus domestica]
MEERKGRRLVLFPLPLQGHINPMLELANILHLKGFSITIIHTHFNSLNPSTYPHFTFHSIPDGLSESEAATKDLVLLLSLLNAKCIEPFRECLVRLLSDASDEPVACLISDVIHFFTESVADSLKIPRIVLRTGGASSFAVFAAFSLLREKGYLPLQESRLEEPVIEFPPIKVKDLPLINRCITEEYSKLVSGLSNGAKASCGVIFNTFEDLEEHALAKINQELPNIPVFPIGPFHKFYPTSSSSDLFSIDSSCISWLDTQAPKSVVYKEVLAHPAIGAFWTHNDWNSTLESVYEGVPMICMPCFTDQMVNARFASDGWKVGLQLENGMEKGEIERTIRKLVVEKEGEEIRERALKLKEKANLCFKQGGSSYQSLDGLVKHILSLESVVFQSQSH